MCAPFVTELPNLTWKVRSVYLGVGHASHHKRIEFQRSPILGVLYLFLRPLMHNDQIRHGNQCGERYILRCQQHHCICTKCVVRFVIDSQISGDFQKQMRFVEL